ncbi:ATP-binding protein [Microvirga mediterraneensis]|uniref:Signal transduction histidine-protein kinase/phosphatase MprB n=1 Tax=Microvirga mediterraneensis TaxID=2754695 RepID=A0A838BUK7_9HYPH|nr:ATP-binding protein [Microvirga mediterraneensis]MBA1158739.1 HAMP domain-containing protein [Microvirga mediterraneensis]
MTSQVATKWRPTLGMIVFAVLATVLALPLVSLVFFRLYENELIRQTEAELIAQSAALAAIFGQEVEATSDMNLLSGALVNPVVSGHGEFDHFLQPSLDLARDNVLGPRPEAAPSLRPPAAPLIAIGQRLQRIVQQTQSITLAGFRLLDTQGVVIAGRDEVGLSLGHIGEVEQALQGRYKAVLRARISNEPPPPLYSLSRGTSVRIFAAMPVIVQGHVVGAIYASRTPNNIIKHIYDQQRKLILAGLSILGATLIIGLIFSRAITRPLHALVARTIEVGHGRREALQPLAHHGTREIAVLSQSFIDMAKRLHNRSDYIATFAAHVTHELKTPLTSIQGAAELLRDDAAAASGSMTPPERLRFLDNIIADTSHLTLMLHRLRELARAENPPVDGQTNLATVIAELKNSFPGLNIRIDGSIDYHVSISAENLSIVFSHLADNSTRHCAHTLWISAFATNHVVVISVHDDGDGISQANQARIFEAFFTTRRESGGTGMGLGIVQAMLQAHHGSIRLLPSEKGATFEIRLPEA